MQVQNFLGPIQNRIAAVHEQVHTLESKVALWSLTVDKIVESELRKELEFQFPDLEQKINDLRLRTRSIKSYISAAVIVLHDAVIELKEGLKHAREQYMLADLNAAVSTLFNIETRFAEYDKIARRTERLIAFRMRFDAFPSISLVDALVHEVYGELMSEPRLSAQPIAAPVCGLFDYLDGQPAAGAEWRLPLNSSFLSAKLPATLWDTVLALRPIASRLYADLNLDSELGMVLSRSAIAPRYGMDVAQAVQATRAALFSDMCAVFLGGPAYVNAVAQSEFTRADAVSRFALNGADLPIYLRWRWLSLTLEQLGFFKEAQAINEFAQRTFGPPEFALAVPQADPTAQRLFSALPEILAIYQNQSFAILGGVRIADCIAPYERRAHADVLNKARSLLSAAAIAVENTELFAGARADAAENQPQRSNKKHKTGRGIETQSSILSLVCALRKCFEVAAPKVESLRTLEMVCREAIQRELDLFLAANESTAEGRDFTQEEAKQLLRQGAYRVLNLSQPGAFWQN